MARRITIQRLVNRPGGGASSAPSGFASSAGLGQALSGQGAQGLQRALRSVGGALGREAEREFSRQRELGQLAPDDARQRVADAVLEAVQGKTGDARADAARLAFAKATRDLGLPESANPVWRLGFSQAVGRDLAARGRSVLLTEESVGRAAATVDEQGLPIPPDEVPDTASVVSEAFGPYDEALAFSGAPGQREYLRAREEAAQEFRNAVSAERARRLSSDNRVLLANELGSALQTARLAIDEGGDVEAALEGVSARVAIDYQNGTSPDTIRAELVNAVRLRAYEIADAGQPDKAAVLVQRVREGVRVGTAAAGKDPRVAADLAEIENEVAKRGSEAFLRDERERAVRESNVRDDFKGRLRLALAEADPGASRSGVAEAVLEDFLAGDARSLLDLADGQAVGDAIRGDLRSVAREAVQESLSEDVSGPDERELQLNFERLVLAGADEGALRAVLSESRDPAFLREAYSRLSGFEDTIQLVRGLPDYQRASELADLGTLGRDLDILEGAEDIREQTFGLLGGLQEGLESVVQAAGADQTARRRAAQAFLRSEEALGPIREARRQAQERLRAAQSQVAQARAAVTAVDQGALEAALAGPGLAGPVKAELRSTFKKERDARIREGLRTNAASLHYAERELRQLIGDDDPALAERQTAALYAGADKAIADAVKASVGLDPADQARSISGAVRDYTETVLGGFRAPDARPAAEIGVPAVERARSVLAQDAFALGLEGSYRSVVFPPGFPPEAQLLADRERVGASPPGSAARAHAALLLQARPGERAAFATAARATDFIAAQDLLEGRVRFEAELSREDLTRAGAPPPPRQARFQTGVRQNTPEDDAAVQAFLEARGASVRIRAARRIAGVPASYTLSFDEPLDPRARVPLGAVRVVRTEAELDALTDEQVLGVIQAASGLRLSADEAFLALPDEERAAAEADLVRTFRERQRALLGALED